MRKYFAMFLLALFAVSATPAVPQTEKVTVTGKLIDLFCYDPPTGANSGMDHVATGAAGQAGRQCAWSCAKWEAQPVGILQTDGTFYQLAGPVLGLDNEKIAPHITHTVTITGTLADNGGIKTLTADDLKMISKE